MTLLTHIRHKRTEERRKHPIRRDVFNQISSVVRLYGLTESFLSELENVEACLSKEKNGDFVRVRLKSAMESPLFSLVTKEEYTLTMSIISRVDSPYLKFTHSPEEILLCGPLYRLNPSIHPDRLMRYHFATLLLHESAKAGKETIKGESQKGKTRMP